MSSGRVVVRHRLSSAIDVLLHRQREVATVIEARERANGVNTDDLAETVRTNTLAAIVELTEVMGEVGWKPWKQEQYGEIASRQRYIGEIADTLLFVMNLLNAQDVTGAELLSALEAKWRSNEQRQREGY